MKLYRCYLCRDDGAAIAWRAFASRDIGDVQVRAVKLLAGVPHAKCIEGRARSTSESDPRFSRAVSSIAPTVAQRVEVTGGTTAKSNCSVSAA